MANVANDSAVADALQETRDLARRPRFWVSVLGTSLVIGLIGPFGTFDDMPLLVRLAYWLVVCPTTFWIGFFPSMIAAAAAESIGASVPVSTGLAGLAASLPVSAWLAGLNMAIFGTPFFGNVITLLPYSVVISIAVSGLFHAVTANDVEGVAPVSGTQAPPWLDQLPEHLGRDLILLQAQDHYVRAETPQGETLVRLSLRDAGEALGGFGLRVHRSWWVARHWMRAYEYRGGAPVVVLRDGQEVPVGRAYRSRVREALRSG